MYGAVPPLAVGEPPIGVLAPAQIETSEPAAAVGGCRTVTTTVSSPIHPLASVTVTIYGVVVVGLAVGLATVAELSPVVGAQEYVYGVLPPEAVGEPPITADPPGQIAVSAPADAVGGVSTVTVIVSRLRHPFASVTRTIYVVVVVTVAVGFAAVVELRPVEGDQRIASGAMGLPPDAVGEPPMTVERPEQTFRSGPALATGSGSTVILIVSLPIHPLSSVTVR